MSEHDNDDEGFAKAALIEAIENQLASDEPPAARAVLNKLTLVGYPREDILELMALVLQEEIADMLDAGRSFDLQRYEQLLRQLPSLPGEHDGAGD